MSSLSIYLAAPVSVGDPGRTRVVFGSVLILVLIGVGLAFAAIWLWRSTRQDPGVLAPLELMGRRAWRRADPVFQRRRLDEVRPAEAQPLARMSPVPETDAEFDRGPRLGDLDDLAEFGASADDHALMAGLGAVSGLIESEMIESAEADDPGKQDSEVTTDPTAETAHDTTDHQLDLSLDGESR